MSRLKILFITPWYPGKSNPISGVFVQEYARAVRSFGDVVVLHCVGPEPGLGAITRIEEEIDENLTQRIPTYRVWWRQFKVPGVTYCFYLWSTTRAFVHITKKEFRPDIIHAHVYKSAVPAVILGRIFHIKVLTSEHSSAFPARRLARREIYKARFAYKYSEKVLPVSEYLQRAIEGYGIRATFQIVPNVVDTDCFILSERVNERGLKYILFVGLLGPNHVKGVPYLLHALQRLERKRADWHLHIVGDGPARSHYMEMAKDLNIFDRITFHGIKSKDEIANLMGRADLFVLPSLYETFGVAAAEALASGLPVIATRCGGPEEFISDEMGMLIPPGNIDALYEALDHMLSNLKNYERARISRLATETFSPEVVAGRLHNVYLELLSTEKP